jgi:hypothetical protein
MFLMNPDEIPAFTGTRDLVIPVWEVSHGGLWWRAVVAAGFKRCFYRVNVFCAQASFPRKSRTRLGAPS